MRTRNRRLIALMITLAAVMTGVNAEAQRRETGNERNDSRKEVRQLKKSKHSNEQRAYRSNEGSRQLKSTARESRKADRNQKFNRDHSSRKYEHKHGNSSWKSANKKSHHQKQKYWAKQHKYSNKHAYRHPKYGNVYRRFYADPVRVHHNHRGDYYFYGGHYYRHHRGVGYVRVEIPRHLVFGHLPFQCEVVRVGSSVYYRYGDLFFESYNRGYRIVPSIDIQLTAHF
ncbi:hypothetical protein [Sunxiuqinia sp. sy24]|uniref:hypothetical protein n=1 Tax=Sunxiuqinia sp. sy24 TaxID=3461495 RepID=UPI004045D17C